MAKYQEISIKEFEDISINHIEDNEAKTGVSVIYFKNGARVGIDISGGGPASRETALTSPLTADNPINAIVLSGGSAFGLAASDGVMKCLEDHDIGYDTTYAKVPLVLGASIYDLAYGKSDVRPDAKMGYEVMCKALDASSDLSGNIGAGVGATVGKVMGMQCASKSGLGHYFIKLGELIIGAIVVVNAVGDIYDEKMQKIAGLMNQERSAYLDSEEVFMNFMAPRDLFNGNTTIGAVITNAKFNKGEMNKIASMTRNAYARSINPVGTMADGDMIFAASTGNIVADLNLVGILGARVMQKAIINAITSSKIDDEEYLRNC